ncbi:MAG: TadE family protein [Planctomycetota bacterium]
MTRLRQRRAARARKSGRLGVEIVELAFALPVMTVIVFGTLELCELLFTRQSLAVAAYEAGRVAARPGANAAAVQTRFDQIVTARRLQNAQMVMTPANLDAIATGERIRIEASAPVGVNTSTSFVLVNAPDAVETVMFVRE